MGIVNPWDKGSDVPDNIRLDIGREFLLEVLKTVVASRL